jgi:hypothetical protein
MEYLCMAVMYSTIGNTAEQLFAELVLIDEWLDDKAFPNDLGEGDTGKDTRSPVRFVDEKLPVGILGVLAVVHGEQDFRSRWYRFLRLAVMRGR